MPPQGDPASSDVRAWSLPQLGGDLGGLPSSRALMGLAWALAVNSTVVGFPLSTPALLTSLQGNPQRKPPAPKMPLGSGPAGCGYEGPGAPILLGFSPQAQSCSFTPWPPADRGIELTPERLPQLPSL